MTLLDEAISAALAERPTRRGRRVKKQPSTRALMKALSRAVDKRGTLNAIAGMKVPR